MVRLTDVFRQAATSRGIVDANHRVDGGRMPETAPTEAQSDFHGVESPGPEASVARVLAPVRDRIPAAFGPDPVRDVQVLAP